MFFVADQLALSLDATPRGIYRQRGVSSLQGLFKAHFSELVARYDAEFAKCLGTFRLERISKAVERFVACGDPGKLDEPSSVGVGCTQTTEV